jgi:predicted ABC-type ATPase
LSEQKPLLVVIAGPMGAGKTTFYDAHLKEAFPTLIPPISHQREAALREQRSFAVEDLVVDTELLESARDAGYATRVVFISTEDPNLNVGRILIRMARGGQSVSLSTIPESYQQSTKNLPEARKHADDVLVYDNTPDGKGHRLVARLIAGELVKTTHNSPEWLKRVFGRELGGETRQRHKSAVRAR